MSLYETVGRNQNAVLSALHHGNEALLDLMKPYFTVSESLLNFTAELPIVDRLPTPKETVEQWFGFWDGLLKEEKEFLLGIAVLFPDRMTKPPVVKPTAKAA
jgi:hypothetical protein